MLWSGIILLALAEISAAPVGSKAPDFHLPKLTDGYVSSRQLKGRPTVLVIASLPGSAPDCRAWMTELIKIQKIDANVLQVAVLDNPWYMPSILVKSQIREFSPEWGHDLVLIEWGRKFGDDYGITKDTTARIVVLGKSWTVLYRYAGALNPEALEKVLRAIHAI